MTDPTITASTRQLAKSVSAIASQLVSDLYTGTDLAASLLWVQSELERLSEEAGAISEEILLKEQGRVGAS